MKYRIVDYCTVEASDSVSLDKWVCDRIREGWQPLGGVSVAFIEPRGSSDSRYYYLFCQAMVQYEEVAQ